MIRFCGMMPSDEIEREERFKDSNDFKITIQAGPNGWTILYADGGSMYLDESIGTEENFNKAYEEATNVLGKLTKVEDEEAVEVAEED